MNLYNLHIDPQSLPHFREAHEYVLDVFWDKYRNTPEELRKREKYIATDAKYSYWYAMYVLKGPFPAGELAISKDAWYAYWYARYILEVPFPAGEAVIAEDVYFSRLYAKYALKADFYLDGKLIAKYES